MVNLRHCVNNKCDFSLYITWHGMTALYGNDTFIKSIWKFKDRFTQHKQTFKNKSKSNATTLSAYTWDKQINTNTDIKWNIIKKCSVYHPGNYNCDLCLTEKLRKIKSANNPNNINKRNDIGSRLTLIFIFSWICLLENTICFNTFIDR